MIRAFPGGICLDARKERVAGLAVVEIPPPPTVVIHLSQHVGQPARPVVGPGDRVETGTMIGEASGPVSAAVHSSVSGRVKSIGGFPHPSGATSVAIEIENDGRDQWVNLSGWRDLTGADPGIVRDAVRDAGIVGLGGAAFPTHLKLIPPAGGRVEVLVANGAECEPYLACDHRAILERAADIVEGVRVMMRTVGAERGLVAVGWNKPDAARSLRRALKGESRIRVAEVETKYPQGAEKQLVKTLTGREVPRGGLPVEVGCLVHNVSTVLAVYECLKFGRPLVSRVITVAGSAAKSPGNFRVRIGTPVGHVIDRAGGAAED
ncbi:MAG: RnfABCDGE type electron transport complex subunit C, partial [bacterium]